MTGAQKHNSAPNSLVSKNNFKDKKPSELAHKLSLYWSLKFP